MANMLIVENVEIGTSRIKRPHKKVRSGCASCKRARVKVSGFNPLNENDCLRLSKCDEKRPRCTRCDRKKSECTYFERPRISSSPPDSRPVESPDSESSRNTVGSDSPCHATLRNIGDTELAKHYLTHTVQTFAGSDICGDQSDIWRILVPAVALTCPVVHQGMLTLAAICLHHESFPDHSGEHCLDYLVVAEAHGKIFVKESRQKLQDFKEGLNTQDQDSILACSRLLCVLAFAFFRTHRHNGTTLADPAAWTWLHLLRGVRTSYAAVVEAGRPVDEMFVKDTTPQLCYHQLAPRMGVGYKNSCFRHVQQSWRGFFDALRSTLHSDWSSLGDREIEDLGAAIDLLYQVTEQICSQQSPNLLRIICTWPADIPTGFVDMLMGKSPPAFVVYAHWLVLMVLVEDLWWVGDMGRAGIRDTIAICSDADGDFRSLLIWPQQMLDMARESADNVPPGRVPKSTFSSSNTLLARYPPTVAATLHG